MIWILEFDNGEGSTWSTIYGLRREALEEASHMTGKRYKTREELIQAIMNQCVINCGGYVIYKADSYYTGA